MINLLELGPTPSEEKCAQVGDYDFDEQSRIETSVFKKQLQRMFPDARFIVKCFPYEDGKKYREVCVVFEEYDDFIEYVEEKTPEYWDDSAKEELKERGYRHL